MCRNTTSSSLDGTHATPPRCRNATSEKWAVHSVLVSPKPEESQVLSILAEILVVQSFFPGSAGLNLKSRQKGLARSNSKMASKEHPRVQRTPWPGSSVISQGFLLKNWSYLKDFLLKYSVCSLLKIKLTLNSCSPSAPPRTSIEYPSPLQGRETGKTIIFKISIDILNLHFGL